MANNETLEIIASRNTHTHPGLTNSAHFVEIRRIQAGSEFKNRRVTVHCFKILKKDKNQQKIYKKLDRILRLLVKKFL
jgi:hypothetical protein